jgi:hypothetical protein
MTEKYLDVLVRRQEKFNREAPIARHATIIQKQYEDKLIEIKKDAQKSIKKKHLHEIVMEEQRQTILVENQKIADSIAEEKEKLQKIEDAKWKPRTSADKYIFPLIEKWNTGFKPEKEKFYHAAFVLTWFVHPKFGICFTGGIERWGKDKNKMKPFGGRREQDKNETRQITATRELYEETAGLIDIKSKDFDKLPCVFVLKTNPCYLLENRIDHNEFRRRLQTQTDVHCQEMKAVVHVSYEEFYNLNLSENDIPGNGIRVNDISGRSTHVSAFFLHALRGFGFV